MHISRKRIATTVFLAAVVLATIFLVDATANYVGAFAALANFELTVRDFDFVANQENINVAISFTIFNPTSYGGMKLKAIAGVFSYEGAPHTVIISPGHTMFGGTPFQAIETRWWVLPSGETAIEQYITPWVVMTASMNLRVIGKDAEIFIRYFEEQGRNQESIRWQLNLRVFLDTPIFLNTISLEYQFNL